jgi:hypothetical protein
MTTEIFAEHNKEVRQKHIKKYGVDINNLTPKQKKEHFRVHQYDDLNDK